MVCWPSFRQIFLEIIFHTIVISCLNYCNSLLSGLFCSSFHLLFVQKCAARLICNHFEFSHIIYILIELQWLSITFRIKFKNFFIYRSLNGLASSNPSNLFNTNNIKRYVAQCSVLLIWILVALYTVVRIPLQWSSKLIKDSLAITLFSHTS